MSDMQNTPSPVRHWRGPEELDPAYWADAAAREKRGQEFFEKPVELISLIDRTDRAGLARRDFLTIMGASMAMASLACARRPVHKIIPHVIKPEQIVPGNALYYASTYSSGYESYGIVAKVRETRPIKLEGNAEHPLSQGALSLRGQASLLSLYDPERLRAPRRRTRENGVVGAPTDAAWADVDAELAQRLRGGVAGRPARVRVLTGAGAGPASRKLMQEFLAFAGGGEHVEYEAISFEEIAEAQALSYGGLEVIPTYRFDRAEYVLSLGADFLGTWLSSTVYARDWVRGRKLDDARHAHARLSTLVVAESEFSVTGANADRRLPIRPGDEFRIAAAIANALAAKGLGDPAGRAAFAGYALADVATETGVSVDALQAVVDGLETHRGRSLVVGGGLSAKSKDALALQLAINFINSALGNEGETLEVASASPRSGFGFAGLSKLIADMSAGRVDVLIVAGGANPAFTLPKSAGFIEALARVGLVAVLSEREDETARLANVALPASHYLESWGDADPRPGVLSVQQPMLHPLHDSRGLEECLLAWMGKGVKWHEYLRSTWRERYGSGAGGRTFEKFWEQVLQDGVLDPKSAREAVARRGGARGFQGASLARVPKYAPDAQPGLRLALYAKNAMYDGSMANNAWIQEMPDPVTAITWDNYAMVSPETAQELNVVNDDVVELKVGAQTLRLPIHVQVGLHPRTVAAAVGYGRTAAGKVGDGAGADCFALAQVEGAPGSQRLVFAGMPVELRKTGVFYRLARTQYHTSTENRPILNDITLAEYRKDPAAADHTDPHLRLQLTSAWPEWKYESHRWGMAIDLNSCTGCGACVIACQAENNIPVVGRDQVRNARQMHWLRIDRYFSGDPKNPAVVFHPMLCQHCENAPCETVCPVLATVHDEEGLNSQIYNRCVGTRYCQNNCPYKVRRFNFFDHWKNYEGELNLAWNPDITVRTRGIMEKCTFCVQRITVAKDEAKTDLKKNPGRAVNKKGRAILVDGALQTACQQTCSTDAIVFGDLNDPTSRVAKLAAEKRSFRALEVLNTKPAISYLSKVRNVEPAAGHGADGGEHHG